MSHDVSSVEGPSTIQIKSYQAAVAELAREFELRVFSVVVGPISPLFSRDGRENDSDSAGAYLCRRSLVADGACRTIGLDQSPHPISNQRSRQDRC